MIVAINSPNRHWYVEHQVWQFCFSTAFWSRESFSLWSTSWHEFPQTSESSWRCINMGSKKVYVSKIVSPLLRVLMPKWWTWETALSPRRQTTRNSRLWTSFPGSTTWAARSALATSLLYMSPAQPAHTEIHSFISLSPIQFNNDIGCLPWEFWWRRWQWPALASTEVFPGIFQARRHLTRWDLILLKRVTHKSLTLLAYYLLQTWRSSSSSSSWLRPTTMRSRVSSCTTCFLPDTMWWRHL